MAEIIGYTILNGHKVERVDYKAEVEDPEDVEECIKFLEEMHGLKKRNEELKKEYESLGKEDWWKDRYRIKLIIRQPKEGKLVT